MDELITKLKVTEESLDERLNSLHGQMKGHLERLSTEHEEKARSWVGPFVILSVLVLVLAGLGLSHLRQLNKMHLL